LPKNKRPSALPSGGNILLFIGITAFLISAAFAAFNYYQISVLKNKAAQIEQQKDLLKISGANLETDREKRRKIDEKAKLLFKLTAERVSLYAILSHLSGIMPPEVWLVEADIKKNGKENIAGNVTIVLKGKALTYGGIAALTQKLEKDEYLLNAVLLKAEKIDSSGFSRFEITAQAK